MLPVRLSLLTQCRAPGVDPLATSRTDDASCVADEEDAGQEQEEETGSPFDSGAEEEHDEARLQAGSPLSDTELAFFDPCAKDAG
ncbi:hypothetical protein scyTo_0025016, partial [Scyliorhinus torazame]|nr:hypothetical protein [Scyliorhinus torazame]